MGRSWNWLTILRTESTGFCWFEVWRSLDFFPVMLRIVITTTLISLRTPRPFCVIPFSMRQKDTTTIVASKILKPSIRKPPLEAKLFKTISIKKMVKKVKSIVSSNFASIVNSDDMVKSNKMKIEYSPIVTRDKFSIY